VRWAGGGWSGLGGGVAGPGGGWSGLGGGVAGPGGGHGIWLGVPLGAALDVVFRGEAEGGAELGHVGRLGAEGPGVGADDAGADGLVVAVLDAPDGADGDAGRFGELLLGPGASAAQVLQG